MAEQEYEYEYQLYEDEVDKFNGGSWRNKFKVITRKDLEQQQREEILRELLAKRGT